VPRDKGLRTKLTAKPRPDSHRLADDSFAGHTSHVLGGAVCLRTVNVITNCILLGFMLAKNAVRCSDLLFLLIHPMAH